MKARAYRKESFNVSRIQRFLEPGPVVLISSRWKNKNNIMTLGWHTLMEFNPSLVGCLISNANYSFDMIRRSKECVINIPEAHLARTVVEIGNCSGQDTDKFTQFQLTPEPAVRVAAPLIKECYANVECRLIDAALVNKYNFFIFEAVYAHAAVSPKYPTTLHYRGGGIFMVSGRHLNLASKFTALPIYPD